METGGTATHSRVQRTAESGAGCQSGTNIPNLSNPQSTVHSVSFFLAWPYHSFNLAPASVDSREHLQETRDFILQLFLPFLKQQLLYGCGSKWKDLGDHRC